MIEVKVSKQSNYPVSTPPLKRRLKDFLKEKGIVSDAQVSVALVGEKKMAEIARQYLGEEKLHSVLSFAAEEAKEKFKFPPDKIIRLGEIVICYPKALEEAKREDKLVEEKVTELMEHGALHLLGIHH